METSSTNRVDSLIVEYQQVLTSLLMAIGETEEPALRRAAELVSAKVVADELVYVYGPGGHSNLAAQETFFRAGGLPNISAILDPGTLLSNGARRSMAMERLPGYGRIVIQESGLGSGDLLILINAYGINTALIDAALMAKELDATVIGVSSVSFAQLTPASHPARHPLKRNLHELVDLHIDSKVPHGDAALTLAGVSEPFGATSSVANAYVMNLIVALAIEDLTTQGIDPPVFRSGNVEGGDDVVQTLIDRMGGRNRWL